MKGNEVLMAVRVKEGRWRKSRGEISGRWGVRNYSRTAGQHGGAEKEEEQEGTGTGTPTGTIGKSGFGVLPLPCSRRVTTDEDGGDVTSGGHEPAAKLAALAPSAKAMEDLVRLTTQGDDVVCVLTVSGGGKQQRRRSQSQRTSLTAIRFLCDQGTKRHVT